jgi:hypothetical protein
LPWPVEHPAIKRIAIKKNVKRLLWFIDRWHDFGEMTKQLVQIYYKKSKIAIAPKNTHICGLEITDNGKQIQNSLDFDTCSSPLGHGCFL